MKKILPESAKEHGIIAKPSITFGSTGVYEEIDAETTFEEYVNEGLGHMISYYIYLCHSILQNKRKVEFATLCNRA